MKNHYDDDDEKQTHDQPNRIRNRAPLLILASWTLGDRVAPEQEEFTENVGGDDHDDIYIMMSVCLCVTKNDHFLYRSVIF